jgi:hypothetical protein
MKKPENKEDKKADTGTVDSPCSHYSRSARAGQNISTFRRANMK